MGVGRVSLEAEFRSYNHAMDQIPLVSDLLENLGHIVSIDLGTQHQQTNRGRNRPFFDVTIQVEHPRIKALLPRDYRGVPIRYTYSSAEDFLKESASAASLSTYLQDS